MLDIDENALSRKDRKVEGAFSLLHCPQPEYSLEVERERQSGERDRTNEARYLTRTDAWEKLWVRWPNKISKEDLHQEQTQED